MQFIECYDYLRSKGLAAPANQSKIAKKRSRIDRLVHRHLESDSEAEDDELSQDPSSPWKAEFERYLNTHDIVPEEMSIVHWWGVCVQIMT